MNKIIWQRETTQLELHWLLVHLKAICCQIIKRYVRYTTFVQYLSNIFSIKDSQIFVLIKAKIDLTLVLILFGAIHLFHIHLHFNSLLFYRNFNYLHGWDSNWIMRSIEVHMSYAYTDFPTYSIIWKIRNFFYLRD